MGLREADKKRIANGESVDDVIASNRKKRYAPRRRSKRTCNPKDYTPGSEYSRVKVVVPETALRAMSLSNVSLHDKAAFKIPFANGEDAGKRYTIAQMLARLGQLNSNQILEVSTGERVRSDIDRREAIEIYGCATDEEVEAHVRKMRKRRVQRFIK